MRELAASTQEQQPGRLLSEQGGFPNASQITSILRSTEGSAPPATPIWKCGGATRRVLRHCRPHFLLREAVLPQRGRMISLRTPLAEHAMYGIPTKACSGSGIDATSSPDPRSATSWLHHVLHVERPEGDPLPLRGPLFWVEGGRRGIGKTRSTIALMPRGFE